MGIKLDISVATPLSDDDRDLLAGISVMGRCEMGTESRPAALSLVREAMMRGPSIMAAQDRSEPLANPTRACKRRDVMRSLRLSLAGTVILVLLAGASGAVTAQEAPGDVYVTGTAECYEPPGRTVQDDGAVELHLFRNECTLTSSDPRLSGTGVYDLQQFCLKEDGGHVCLGSGTSEVTGLDGKWVGTLGWVQDPSRAILPSWGVLEGTGRYEGWTYVYHIPDLMAPSSPEYGILYQGPPPPWGTTLPLTPDE